MFCGVLSPVAPVRGRDKYEVRQYFFEALNMNLLPTEFGGRNLPGVQPDLAPPNLPHSSRSRLPQPTAEETEGTSTAAGATPRRMKHRAVVEGSRERLGDAEERISLEVAVDESRREAETEAEVLPSVRSRKGAVLAIADGSTTGRRHASRGPRGQGSRAAGSQEDILDFPDPAPRRPTRAERDGDSDDDFTSPRQRLARLHDGRATDAAFLLPAGSGEVLAVMTARQTHQMASQLAKIAKYRLVLVAYTFDLDLIVQAYASVSYTHLTLPTKRIV